MAKWGEETRIKYVGGYLVYREAGTGYQAFRDRIDDMVKRSADMSEAFDRFRRSGSSRPDRPF